MIEFEALGLVDCHDLNVRILRLGRAVEVRQRLF